MDLLVKFIAVDNKIRIDDNYTYINRVFEDINSIGLIKNLNIDPVAATFGAGAIRELDEEGNVYLLNFNSREEDKSNIWSIYFAYGTYNHSKQLEISIYSDTYITQIDDIYLEKLKLRIKKCISKDWDKIIWLVDKDSECLSICLYPQIYKAENLMRELITEVMTKQYGTSWWDTFAPVNIKDKHSSRLKEYKSKVPAFRDVDEKLMSIDIEDLGKLVKLQRYKWNPVYDERINSCLNGVQGYNNDIVTEALLKQRIIETDLWRDQFSKYLPEDFNDRFSIFTKDRNHIMHNKLIDRAAFASMREVVKKIEEDLVKAIKKVQSEILSNEEKFEIEKQKKIERQMLEEWDHECREKDTNVSIRDSYEIETLFREILKLLVNGIREKLRFRNDIEIISDFEGIGYNGKLFSSQSRIDEIRLDFVYDMYIDNSEGAESLLKIRCSNGELESSIGYRNGKVEYDEDSALYIPITKDEIDNVDCTIDFVVAYISTNLFNYMENAKPEDVVEYLMCCECGTESICVNEDVLPVGTCMNCGYVNEIHECDRCYSWFNSELDGRVTEDISICQNCLDELLHE